jgi:hypothetical protein
MQKKISISEERITSIQEECANEIAYFGNKFQELRRMFEAMGLYYPRECVTNYRDAWFHYRKLCQKKDSVSVLNEKYGLEEHLLRAVKDAQIGFLQQLAYWLEIWYKCDEYMECDLTRRSKYLRLFENLDQNWVKSIWDASEGDIELFANACLFRFQEELKSEDLRIVLQNLIHSMKKIILKIRLGGVDISRPLDNSAYLDECIPVIVEMCEALSEVKMMYLIPATDLILMHCTRSRSET